MNMHICLRVLPVVYLKDRPTFQFEVKGALQVTIELLLKMRVVMHLLKQKSAQNDSIKGELEKTFYGTLEEASKISL